mgnify:CR=1 FL=1
MERNLCFIVMGFGKKKDPDTNRTIDLDATYKKIIRPAVESAGCKCIRADEIVESGIIDRSMYALLYYADIVIADISTFNPNAIYELGVRHALRPYSTIIIKEDEGKIPFDIGHDRIISYKHLGNEISEAEAKKCIPQLRTLIQSVINEPKTDSPLYSYIHQIKKPEISEEEISSIIGELKNNEDSIYALTEMAKEEIVKKNFKAVAAGIVSGVLASLVSVLVLAKLFGLSHEQYVTLLPKSITTAIGMGISEELGGIVTITVAVIIITGILGNVIAELVCKVFHIQEPIAKGLALGTASHAIGTAKAMEMGPVEGAMSSLAIAVAGLLTVIGASVFAGFM